MEQVSASDADLIVHLQNIRKAAIMRALNGVFPGKQVIDQLKLYSRYGVNDSLEVNSGKFIGYEIIVSDKTDAAMQIDSLYVYLDSVVTFNVYLFKDGELAPVMTQAVTTVANKITEVSLTAERILSRGRYYLGYFQADLGAAKAYNEQVDVWNTGCHFSVNAFQATATGATTFNRNELSYTYNALGLNAELSSFTDHTLQIKRKAGMFDELIGLTLAYPVIEQIVYAVRSSVNERITKEAIDKVGVQLDLNGYAPISESPQVMGLKQRIDRETQRVLSSFYPRVKSRVVNVCW